MKARLLAQADYPDFEAFLRTRAATSMFLRSNARQAGLVFAGEDYQAHYVGAFDGDNLAGVIGFCWNGFALVQAQGAALDAIVDHAKQTLASFRVKGSNGPDAQVRAFLARLSPRDDEILVGRGEGIFHLRLADMKTPAPLRSGAWRVRRGAPADEDVMAAWQAAFSAEGLNARVDAGTERASRADIERWIADRRGFVLEAEGRLVSQCAFNGQLPDIVQIGGVFTPPELRGRGYARAVVAGALGIAQSEGVTESLLFTQNPQAERAYIAIGYQRVDDYYLAIFREGVDLGDAH